jgi:AAA ATPase domain
MSDPRQAQTLLGRRRECRVLDDLLEATRAGRSSVLVVCGDPGVGKSVLAQHLVERATDCRVLRTEGVESEMELPSAGLQQLLGRLLTDGVEDLPLPQREALQRAFGLIAGPAPDRFLVSVAALSLLSAAAEDRPLLCVVDDVIGSIGRRCSWPSTSCRGPCRRRSWQEGSGSPTPSRPPAASSRRS